MRIVKIISTAIEKGNLMIKILGLGSKDVRTLYNILPFGIDSNPSKDYRAIYADTDDKGNKICIGIINKKVLTNVGELRIFSEKTDGSDSFSIILKNNETCEIGGNSDNFVRYSKLNEALQNFKTTLTAQLTAALPTLTWTPANTESVIMNITASKIDEIKTS